MSKKTVVPTVSWLSSKLLDSALNLKVDATSVEFELECVDEEIRDFDNRITVRYELGYADRLPVLRITVDGKDRKVVEFGGSAVDVILRFFSLAEQLCRVAQKTEESRQYELVECQRQVFFDFFLWRVIWLQSVVISGFHRPCMSGSSVGNLRNANACCADAQW